MPPSKPLEHRSDYRYHYITEIDFGSDFGSGKGTIRNISLGGIYIAAKRKLPVGTHVLVSIPFPVSVRIVSLHGMVVRITGDGFAIAFLRRRQQHNSHGTIPT